MQIQSSLAAASAQADRLAFTRSLTQTTAAGATDSTNATDFTSSLDPQMSTIFDAQTSVANGVSFTQTQASLLQNVGDALDKMSQLATAAQSPDATDADRAADNKTFQSLGSYINNVAGQDFNGVSLFSANDISVSADASGGTASLPGVNLSSSVYTNATSADISTLQGPPAGGATSALSNLQAAIKQLAADRATVSGNKNHLETISHQLDVSAENVNAATSFDITSPEAATQSAATASASILDQSTTSLLAQGQHASNAALVLLAD